MRHNPLLFVMSPLVKGPKTWGVEFWVIRGFGVGVESNDSDGVGSFKFESFLKIMVEVFSFIWVFVSTGLMGGITTDKKIQSVVYFKTG